MTDPNVRVAVQGIPAAERRIEQLLQQRRRVERVADEALRKLAKIDGELRRIERELRRTQ